MSVLQKRIIFFSFLATLVSLAGLAQMDPCDDLGEIDFGDCEAVLGWGMIDGSCTLIIGCSSPVPLFASQAGCEEACLPQPTCDDLANVDFGPCDAVLGYGVVGGECVEITGCDSPVPLFSTAEECLLECGTVATESTNWSSLKARYR